VVSLKAPRNRGKGGQLVGKKNTLLSRQGVKKTQYYKEVEDLKKGAGGQKIVRTTQGDASNKGDGVSQREEQGRGQIWKTEKILKRHWSRVPSSCQSSKKVGTQRRKACKKGELYAKGLRA